MTATTDARNTVLAANNISHAFGDLEALRDVSLALAPQTFTCLVGPSGCGKSTLLRMMGGLLRPDKGAIYLHEALLTRPNRQISLVFQQANLMPWRSVRQNLVLPLEIEGRLSAAEIQRRVDAYLLLLGLQDFADAYPKVLSGGMAQRLAVGRALIHEPEVLLLDEPFGALDALTREQISEELLNIWAQTQKTVLMVTHSIQEAVLLSDRVVVMSPRPGQILHEFAIDLPRPRSMSLVVEAAFTHYEAQIRAALRRE